MSSLCSLGPTVFAFQFSPSIERARQSIIQRKNEGLKSQLYMIYYLLYKVHMTADMLQVYHVLCFTCLLCNKKLDSGLLTEKDGDIFCKGICIVNLCM